jgi:hypothetical protein
MWKDGKMNPINRNASDESLKEYIQYLYESHVVDVENLTVWEMALDFFGYDLTDEQFDQVFDLMGKASVSVIVGWEDE